MLSGLVRWSLERPRLTILASLFFLVWGALAVRDMGFDLLPQIAPAEVSVRTEAPGLVAEQVENLVTRPIETNLIGVPKVAQVRSESVQGLSTITVNFAQGADPDRARLCVAHAQS